MLECSSFLGKQKVSNFGMAFLWKYKIENRDIQKSLFPNAGGKTRLFTGLLLHKCKVFVRELDEWNQGKITEKYGLDYGDESKL